MTYEHIRYEKRGAVAVITYDKQERRNAWSPPLYRETERAIESANEDEEVGAIVLTHEGPIFCAGTDFKAGPEVDPDTGGKLNIAQICMMQDKGWIHLLVRSEEHTSELQSIMRISYAVFCLKQKNNNKT